GLPEIFRRWTAISTIAGALERKVWIRFNGETVYPHLYILLVSGPGVGKSRSIRRGEKLLGEVPDAHLAPTSVSRASLIDSLNEAERIIVRPGEASSVIQYNSMTVCADELGAFMPAYDGEFISTLNKLYDGGTYVEQKRHMKAGTKIVMKEPQLNLIAGTTPGWLAANLPQHAWSEGLMSRMVLVQSNESILTDPFEEKKVDHALHTALAGELLEIASSDNFGVIEFDVEAAALIRHWYLNGQEPIPAHNRLRHYLPRRPIHLLKIAMCFCMARSRVRVILPEDIRAAMDLLFETETRMPLIFRDMTEAGGDVSIAEEICLEVERLFLKNQQPLFEYQVNQIIMKRVPHYTVQRMLQTLVDANMITFASMVSVGGKPSYKPVPKKEWNP
ncbi:MAG: DUF3987 domain-containing protein, partial [Patescibacteria group bacterium]|nr:DUF3987 domain-containing protein [Patescibacteria group bacterium]